MAERLRILKYISPKYFQTLEVMEKTISDKNEPKWLLYAHIVLLIPVVCMLHTVLMQDAFF